MFEIYDDMSIYITRGDVAFFSVTADDNGTPYKFKTGDVVRIKVFKKKDCADVAFQKDFPVIEECEKVDIILTEAETKIGDVISKPVDYWYEIELNPYTNPQTIIGYDDDGAKIFKLFPEGRDLEPSDITEEDIPVVDNELSLTSQRPVENQAVTRAILGLSEEIKTVDKNGTSAVEAMEQTVNDTVNKISKDMEMLEIEVIKDVNTLEREFAAETFGIEKSLAVESARINNLVANTGAQTEGNAELIDIRVGYNGAQYPTAGEAIREQISVLTENMRSAEITEKALKYISDSITLEPNDVVGTVTIELGTNSSVTVFKAETSDPVVYSTNSTNTLTETIAITEKTVFSSNGGDVSVKYYKLVNIGNLAGQLSDGLAEKLSAGQSITLTPDNVIDGKVILDIDTDSSVTVWEQGADTALSYGTDMWQGVTQTVTITMPTDIICTKGACTVRQKTVIGEIKEDISAIENELNVFDEEVDNLAEEVDNLAEEVDNLAPAIIPTVSGESITVNDSANRRIEGLELFGKTKQNGIPTPDSPLNFDNVGDSGSFNISVGGEQTLTIPTPNGLMGVKATSDGNYTDDNGQQWMCDVIDYERGKYIQNVKIANAKDLTWGYSSTGFFYVSLTKCNLALCTHYLNIGIMTDTEALDKADKTMSTFKNLNGIRVMDTRYTNVNDFISSMGDMKILYALPNPIERDLTEAEMVDYTQVHTNYPDTTITNDADAGMDFKYVADTKLYIDNKFAELQSAILSTGANI